MPIIADLSALLLIHAFPNAPLIMNVESLYPLRSQHGEEFFGIGEEA
jgi:hypothetical protein